MRNYKIELYHGELSMYSCEEDLEYIPECFIFEGEVYIVTHRMDRLIHAELSTPSAIHLITRK